MEQEDVVERTVNVGLIGVGRIGALHAEHLSYRVAGANLVALADVREDVARACAERLGVPTVVEDHRALLVGDAIDAVVICSSTDTHAQIMTDAARAGKHIFCEKPIDLDLARVDAALQAVDAAGVKLQVGFNRRFDPNFQRVRDLVAQGAVGTPHILRITSRDPAPPPVSYIEVSGGIFLDMTIHDFDMARYLMGDEVVEVYAVGGVLIDPAIGEAGDVDTAVVMLRFAGGAIGTIDNSRQAVYGYDQRVEVFGSEGMVSAGNETTDRTVYADSKGMHGTLPLYFFIERYTDAYIAEMQAFVHAVQADSDPPVTGLDGRAPIVIGRAATLSLREGRPVRVDEVS
jgi:myo-inositol 2-dehydrogenase/D-chiro-inositol 1-dehydrogenase